MFSVVRHRLHRHPLDDLEAVTLDAAVLRRVVRHQPHRGDAEVDEDLRADAVLARVGREAELEIRLDRVAALVLQRVRAQLVAEPDAAAFVAAQVHDDALALLRDLLERAVELHAAVAPQRPEHVAGEALAVHAHEHVLLPGDLAPHEREVLGVVEQRLEDVRGEVAVLRRDTRLRHPPHELLVVAAEPDEIGDRDEHEAVLLRERLEVGPALHRAVVVHDLGEHAGRVAAGEPGEVDGGLGVTGPLQHAAFAVAQREDVARAGRDRPASSSPSISASTVAHRSAAEMPVVVPMRASTDTVNAVR